MKKYLLLPSNFQVNLRFKNIKIRDEGRKGKESCYLTCSHHQQYYWSGGAWFKIVETSLIRNDSLK